VGLSAGLAAALLVLLLGAASGCVYHHHPHPAVKTVHARDHGPPPHAPAHGYRTTHPRDGVVLVFDAGLGVYTVAGWPGYYWHSDHYLRWVDGSWRTSRRIGGSWVVVSLDRVPAKLAAKHGRKAHGHQKQHPGPAKHDH
jgi:hypothetical protein